MTERNIYIAIMVAAARGTGLKLTAQEVFDLSRDSAIATAATNFAGEEACKGWAAIDPRKPRTYDAAAEMDAMTR